MVKRIAERLGQDRRAGRGGRTRGNARTSILNGAFSVVATGTVGAYLPIYLLDGLHATNQEVALSNALPALLGAIAIGLAAAMVTRIDRYKPLTAAATLASRLMYALLSLAPLFGASGAAMAIYANSASSFFQGFAGLWWQALIDRIVPARLRAGFFSERNLITTAVSLVSTLVLGIGLSLFHRRSLFPYQVIFVLATIAGIGEAFYLWRHHEPPAKAPFVAPGEVAWKAVFRSRAFLTFVGASAFFNLGWQMAWPLYSIYQIRLAHATSLWVGFFTIAGQMGQIASFRRWGHSSTRRGNLLPLAIAGFGLALSPALTILSRALPWLVFTNLEGGVFTAGINLLLFNQLLAASPKTHRASYIAAYNIVLGLVGFVAPEIGVYLLRIVGMDGALLVSAVWRLFGALAFLSGTGLRGSGLSELKAWVGHQRARVWGPVRTRA